MSLRSLLAAGLLILLGQGANAASDVYQGGVVGAASESEKELEDKGDATSSELDQAVDARDRATAFDILAKNLTPVPSSEMEAHRKLEILNTKPSETIWVRDTVYLVNFSNRNAVYRYHLGQSVDHQEVSLKDEKFPAKIGKDAKGVYVESLVSNGTNRLILQYKVIAKQGLADLSITKDKILRGVKVFYHPRGIKMNAPTFQEYRDMTLMKGAIGLEDGYFKKGSKIKIEARVKGYQPTGVVASIKKFFRRLVLKIQVAYYEATDPDPMFATSSDAKAASSSDADAGTSKSEKDVGAAISPVESTSKDVDAAQKPKKRSRY